MTQDSGGPAGAMPAIFVSHGSPMLVFEDIPARDFLAQLGQEFGRPRAVLCISAHWETAAPMIGGATAPETIHDFYGFPEALYRLRYPAPGAPDLATRVVDLLGAAGLEASIDPARGLDHGAWNPLMLMFPKADVPVTQLSIQPSLGPDHHLALGRALAPLRQEGVLVMGSGGAVHNLAQFRVDRMNPADWAIAFDDWLGERISAGDEARLVNYRRMQAGAAEAHPTDEHLLPLFVALGAGAGAPARELHRSFAHGSLSMAAYAWG
jgi:4,5-DOPA dioxygenase extradiol